MDESSYRAELEALPTKALYLRARRRAVRRPDLRFFWTLLGSIPRPKPRRAMWKKRRRTSVAGSRG